MFILAASAILAVPERYTATAEVVVDPHAQQALDMRAPALDSPLDTLAVDTEVELLKSPALAARVARAFDLDRDPEFMGKAGLELFNGAHDDRAAIRRRNAAVDRLQRRLKVARVGFTYVIAVSATSVSPDKAAALANAVARFYLQQQLDAKVIASRHASDLLNGRLGGLRAEVDAAQHAVERYKADHGLMTLADSDGATSTEQEISDLDTQLVAARGQQADAEARLSAGEAETAGGRAGDNLAEVLNSPVVQDLRKKRNEVVQTLSRYGPRHPARVKAEQERESLDAQIGQEIARVVSNLRVQAEVSRSHTAAIAAATAKAKAELARHNNAAVELRRLQQNLDSVKGLYQAYLDRFKQTLAQDGMAQADARLVTPAKAPPSPSGPNRPLLMAIALTGSVLFALLAIWAAEVREDGLYAPEDVEARLGLTCLGLLPAAAKPKDSDLSPADLVLQQPLSGFSEAFRALKAELMLRRASGPVRTIAITSALPGEGKTTTSLCLARTMAKSGAATLLVDCDLRRRTMSKLLSTPPSAGLLEVLAAKATLDEALVADDASGLHILPLGDEDLADDDVFSTPAMGQLLETFRRRFRMVILDTAPVLMVADTPILASRADAVVFLSRWAKTPADAAANAVRRLEGAGAYVMGAAITQVDLRYARHSAYPYAASYYPFYRPEEDQERRGLFKPRWSRAARHT